MAPLSQALKRSQPHLTKLYPTRLLPRSFPSLAAPCILLILIPLALCALPIVSAGSRRAFIRDTVATAPRRTPHLEPLLHIARERALGEEADGSDADPDDHDHKGRPVGGRRSRMPPRGLKRFVDELTVPPVVAIPHQGQVTIHAFKIQQTFHSYLPPTWVYAFGTSKETAATPGPTIVVQRGDLAYVTWANDITDETHMFAVDYTVGAPVVRGVPLTIHLHGAHVHSHSDGHPDAWHTAFGDVGPTFVNTTNTYTNHQQAGTMWYHDHTVGMTRLNAVAGLAGFYLITDPKHEELGLPSGKYDVGLAFQDKSFTADGQIFFPKAGANPGIHPHWEPEYFGDYITVNGKVSPFMEVDRRKYRLRLLNAANARFFVLKFRAHHLLYTNGMPTNKRSFLFPFTLIGADLSLFAKPVVRRRITIGPGERVDLIVDFSQLPSGVSGVRLVNTGASPYEDGDDPTQNQRQVMLFLAKGPRVADNSRVPSVLNTIPMVDPSKAINYPNGRIITLSELKNPVNDAPEVSLLEGKGWRDPVTVTPANGDVELWTVINLTDDWHAFHIHFTSHQLVSRRPFAIEKYRAGLCRIDEEKPDSTLPSCYTGPTIPPRQQERGWKDTSPAPQDMVVKLLIGFPWKGEDPPFDPSTGPGYVFHCHMLDHEDNDMMRPFRILPSKSSVQGS